MTRLNLLPTHRRLRFPRGGSRLDAYASLYRHGDPAQQGPVLVYIGGAAGRDKYLARLETEPAPIRVEIENVLAAIRLHRLDIFICPCPEDSRLEGESEAAGMPWFEDHWDRELLPALGDPPSAVGLVGHSAGAGWAMHLGIVLEASAVASLGGVGVVQAARSRDIEKLLASLAEDGWGGLDIAMYRNDGDEAPDPARMAISLPRPLRPYPKPPREGGHRFESYAQNGSAADAFRFVLERLSRAGAKSGGCI